MNLLTSFFSLTTCHLCRKGNNILCEECLQHLPSHGQHEQSIVLYDYRGKEIHALLQQAKYKRLYQLYSPLIMFKKNEILSFFEKNSVDLIVPIPSPRRRTFFRGHCHTETIASHVSLLTKKKTMPLLKKKTYTKRQVTLSRRKRIVEQRNSFSIENTSFIKGKDVLLVDDITTTGSTLQEAGAVLLSAGAKHVYTFTIAH